MQLAQQGIVLSIAHAQLDPVFVRQQHQDYSSASSYNLTLAATPVEGNLMVLFLGGIQSVTPTLAGWSSVLISPSSARTMYFFHKFASAGESTSINITFTGNLQGALHYFEFSDIDPISPRKGVDDTGREFTTATSRSWGNYDVDEKAAYIQGIAFDSTETNSVNNGFVFLSGGGQRANAAYRVYTTPAIGENTSWTFSSSTGALGMIAFKGRHL